MTAGFGLEKLGLLTLKFPKTTLLIVAAVLAVFVYGNSRIGFSSDIREIFRSGSADFETLEEVSRLYPGSDRDVLIVVEGDNLFAPETLEALRNLHLDMSLVPGVTSTLSIFSARHPPDANGAAEALIPAELPSGADMEALRREVRADPLVAGRLLSDDGRLALVAVSLDQEERDVNELGVLIGEIDTLAKETLSGKPVEYTLTGTSVMRVEIIGALIRDQQTFRAIGLGVATFLCWLFFRSFPYVLISLAPTGLAIFGLKGGMGLAGQDINVLTNVIPGLVMVIAFASALHMLFAMRRKRSREVPVEEAIREAVVEVGPACVLTTATTTIALLSLAFVPHPFIRNFGLIAASGTAFTFVAIMVTVPPLGKLLLGRNPNRPPGWGKAEPIHRAFDHLSSLAANLVLKYPRRIAAAGAVAALVCGSLYALNETQYQYKDNLPQGNPASRAINEIDERLSGTDTMTVLIQWPEDAKPGNAEMLAAIDEAHAIMETEGKLNQVSSLHGVKEWYESGTQGNGDLLAFLEKADTPLTRRFTTPDGSSTVLRGYFGSMPAAELVGLTERLDRKLDPLRKKLAPARIEITGLVTVSAKASTEMIGQLNMSLLAAVAFIIVLIGVAYRSVFSGVVSILPNILPIFVAGAGLYLTGKGLQFTSVVAFTIGFGIAVDSTIHVLNRYRLARQAGEDTAQALDTTINRIGSVLIVATLVLIAGIGGTIFSELPMVRLYGEVIVVLLAMALAGALLFLPAMILVAEGWFESRPGRKGAAKKAKSSSA